MAYPAAGSERGWRAALSWRRIVEAAEAYPLERIGLAAIAAGVLLRLAAPFLMDFRSDGDTYVAMGHAWMVRHEFLMPYGDVTTWGPTPPGYSNHYPPAYPFYLGLVFSAFGFGLWQAKWAAVVCSLAALAIVWWTTRDLYGRTAAALVGGLIGLEPHLLWVTGAGFSENMVLLFFALTMWAILKSLKDDRYIVLAGLFAALAYLSRASVGYFFVVAGTGGFVWRLLHRGWSVLLNVWYMLAIVVFLGIAIAWATRNVLLFGSVPQTLVGGDLLLLAAIGSAVLGVVLALPFLVKASQRSVRNLAPAVALVALGSALGITWGASKLLGDPLGLLASRLVVDAPLWETSSYTRYVQELALERTGDWRHALVAKVPLFLAFLAWFVIPFLPESWKAAKKIREEQTSALFLSVILVWLIAWAIASMFWVFEKSSLYWLDNHRYIVIGILPLAWLIVREARPERASFRARYAVMVVTLFLICAATIYAPVRFADLRAAEHMDPYLQKGDEIAVDGGTIKYAFYAYLTNPRDVQVYGWGTEGYSPEFIISLKGDGQYGANHTKAAEFRQTFWTGGVMTAHLYVRNDVLAERSVPTGVLVAN